MAKKKPSYNLKHDLEALEMKNKNLRNETVRLNGRLNRCIDNSREKDFEIEELKQKVTIYMDLACTYRDTNSDLKARYEEVEELLSQTETSLEIATKSIEQANKEIAVQKKMKEIFQESSFECEKVISELREEVKEYKLLLEVEKSKTAFDKMKERFKRGRS